MKKSNLAAALMSLVLLPVPTACQSGSPLKVMRLANAQGRLAKIYNISDLHRMIDTKKTFALAVTDSSTGSATLRSTLKNFVLETEAVIYEISLSLYTELDTSFGFPRLSASKAPALILVDDGVKAAAFDSQSKVSTTSKKFASTLRSKLETGPVYCLDDYNGTTESYYFYQNTAGRLDSYIAGSDQSDDLDRLVVFYDSSLQRDSNFVYDFLFRNAGKDSERRFDVLDISYYKYDYEESSHSLTLKRDYQSFAARFTYGNYNPDGTPVTPALNFYQNRALKKTLIYGYENLADPLGTYEVTKSSKSVANFIASCF